MRSLQSNQPFLMDGYEVTDEQRKGVVDELMKLTLRADYVFPCEYGVEFVPMKPSLLKQEGEALPFKPTIEMLPNR